MMDGIRQRQLAANAHQIPSLKASGTHPGGDIKHGAVVQIIRLLLIISYFCISCIVIVLTQLLGTPLYFINRKLYYSYMSMTKQSFGIFVTTLTKWWAPTVMRISGDHSVAGQLHKTVDGEIECLFPERLVLIANHQLYSDWLYLWWAAYTNRPKMHGHIFIILKESLKRLPVIGWGMRFYGFIFMSRKFAVDAPRISYRLQKLKEIRSESPCGKKYLDPMWLLLFPEGTNASDVGRVRSAEWAKKKGIKDLEHTLLPRSTGTFFCLNELKGTVDYLYDCTLAYEGVKRGEFGQDTYTLRSMFLRGQPPPSVNMYWRRFELSQIPLHDGTEFDLWLHDRWLEKDALLEHFTTKGLFPPSPVLSTDTTPDGLIKNDYIETEVRTNHWWEVISIFNVLATFILSVSLLVKGWNVMISGAGAI
ncbi:unnamed protein product [Blumeria hordei]|uniref:Phospholipid/glycerol acyltransferase domain-containing protein n=2 Tax=Blumeria hordei TaxID=2867405 RepID=A0A383UJR8_BLUHO|nr:1-acyl-sn-glycerol-3-phosphate acyltransferase gamma [Blumeria hordei DH14]SZE99825.1 unnamed protein product [Blumeria hordei]